MTAANPSTTVASDPTGLHRVLEPAGVLPQAAQRLDTRRELWADEVRIRVERLNLDAARFRQLERKHGGDGDAIRAEVLDIVRTRGKMQNPVTGSGGMLIGTVEEVGPELPARPARRRPGHHPRLADAHPAGHRRRARPLGRPQRAGARRRATPSCSAARSPRGSPTTSPAELSLSVMDVCGAPALTARVVREYVDRADAAGTPRPSWR